jgi:hypothetical protein
MISLNAMIPIILRLYAIIFPIIFLLFFRFSPDYFSDYVGLYAIILSTIYDDFTDLAPGKWECVDSNS